jgi:cytochrome c-type biogenesis protein
MLRGGLVSFLSPCVLPIVPAYLSVITGLEIGELQESRGHLARIARDTGLFIAGFSAVFILLGLSATSIGQALFDDQGLITRLSGLVVLAMALFVVGSLVLRSPGLYQERRLHPDLSRFGRLAGPGGRGGVRVRVDPLHRARAQIDPRHRRYPARLGPRRPATGRVLGRARRAFLATGLAFARLAGALTWVKRHSKNAPRRHRQPTGSRPALRGVPITPGRCPGRGGRPGRHRPQSGRGWRGLDRTRGLRPASHRG